MLALSRIADRVLCAVIFGASMALLRQLKRKQLGAQSHAPVLPLDIRLGLTKPLGADQKVRWAVLGTGRVAHDFVQALKSTQGAEVVVVAARNAERLAAAQDFATRHGVERAVGSYAEALAMADVDVVYLATTHQHRRAQVSAILDAGKHAVVEKPLALNARDAQYMVDLARKRQLFLLEGIWTRFFPTVERARELLDQIGPISAVFSDFGFDATDGALPYPTRPKDPSDGDPIWHKSLGGGALLWTGCYPITAGLLPFGATWPSRIRAAGLVDPNTGVEMQASIALDFPNAAARDDAPPGSGQPPACGASVSLFCGVDVETRETTTYVGKRGRVIIEPPAHCPTRLTLEEKVPGARGECKVTVFEEPLPDLPPSALSAKSPSGELFYYPNSNGFQYEAAAVQRCIRAGLTECPQASRDPAEIWPRSGRDASCSV